MADVPPSRPRLARPIAAAALAAIAAFVLFLRLPLIDDAHIAMCYARSLATSGTWGMVPGHTANAATSPLNVIALAAVGGVVRSFPLAAQIVAILSFWTVFLCASSIGRAAGLGGIAGVLVVVAVAANPSVLSAIGLEGPLVAALMVACAWAVVRERWRALGVLLGLLVLARMDTVLLAAIAVAACVRRGAPWRMIAGPFLLTTLPWFLFSWVALGSAIPDTFFLKTAQSWGEGLTFLDGPAHYFSKVPLVSVASVVLLPCVPFAFAAAPPVRRVAGMLVGYAAASFAAYALLGPPPYAWYFLQQVIPVAVVGALGTAEAARRFGRGALAAGAAPATALAVVLAAGPFPRKESLYAMNFATTERYAEIGRAIAALTSPDDGIEAHAEIGTLVYYSDRYLQDEFSDRSRTDTIIRTAGYAGRGWAAPLVKLNFACRRITPPTPYRWRLTVELLGDDPSVSASDHEWDCWTQATGHARLTLAPLTGGR